MSKADLIIRGDIVTPDRVISDGYVAVSGATIEAIGEGTPPALPWKPKTIAAAGSYPVLLMAKRMPPASSTKRAWDGRRGPPPPAE